MTRVGDTARTMAKAFTKQTLQACITILYQIFIYMYFAGYRMHVSSAECTHHFKFVEVICVEGSCIFFSSLICNCSRRIANCELQFCF